MTYPKIIFHGATRSVTGSCHELSLDSQNSILIDCGTTQGDEYSDHVIDFPVDHIRALVITHVHIDHVGRIPYLLAAGFNGPIICTEASAVLLPIMLEDAVKIGFSRNKSLVKKFINKIKDLIVPVSFKDWFKVSLSVGAVKIKFKPAGHILGSAYVECDANGSRYIFSGDLGAPYAPLLPAPRSPYKCDVLVLESTYGDHCHEGRKNRRGVLKKIILQSLKNRGVILIPAFSIGRTQELLYEIEELIHQNCNRSVTKDLSWNDLEVIIDSPLAADFTQAYKKLKTYWDSEALRKLSTGRHPLSFEQVTTISSHEEHLQTVTYLRKKARPCIVIAGSGMCSGGRIVNYLKALIDDKRTDILFVGYQAAGTPGREIQYYGPDQGFVKLEGQRYTINAGIHTIYGYSAHADQKNLVNFVKRMRNKPKNIYLVHGEEKAKASLKEELFRIDPTINIVIPN